MKCMNCGHQLSVVYVDGSFDLKRVVHTLSRDFGIFKKIEVCAFYINEEDGIRCYCKKPRRG